MRQKDKMRINTDYKSSSNNFKSLFIPQVKTQRVVIKNLDNIQLEELVNLFEKEKDNPIKAIINFENDIYLKA